MKNCPLCGTPLPDNAQACTRCDWVVPESPAHRGAHIRAAVLSVIPGAGHLYKGHLLTGLGIFAVGNLVIIPLAIVLLPGTLGVSLAIIPLFVGIVMVHAFLSEDLRAEERAAAAEGTRPFHPGWPVGTVPQGPSVIRRR